MESDEPTFAPAAQRTCKRSRTEALFGGVLPGVDAARSLAPHGRCPTCRSAITAGAIAQCGTRLYDLAPRLEFDRRVRRHDLLNAHMSPNLRFDTPGCCASYICAQHPKHARGVALCMQKLACVDSVFPVVDLRTVCTECGGTLSADLLLTARDVERAAALPKNLLQNARPVYTQSDTADTVFQPPIFDTPSCAARGTERRIHDAIRDNSLAEDHAWATAMVRRVHEALGVRSTRSRSTHGCDTPNVSVPSPITVSVHSIQ